MRLDLQVTLICAFGPLSSTWMCTWIFRTLGIKPANFYLSWGFTAAVELCIAAFQHMPAPVVAAGANVVLAAIFWWLSRRRRKRAAKLAGAKSRARLAAVVRTMRERAKPRPVFRPQPQGA